MTPDEAYTAIRLAQDEHEAAAHALADAEIRYIRARKAVETAIDDLNRNVGR